MKKVLAIALAAVLAVMFLAACGDASSSSSQATDPGSSSSQAASTSEPAGPTYGGNDISEEVTLRYLMVAPQKAPDHDMVWDVINARAKELINATVNVEIMLMSDHEERYGLELAAGEPYDVVFTGSWMHYASEAPAGAFQEITLDMVHQYMPQTLPDSAGFDECYRERQCPWLPRGFARCQRLGRNYRFGQPGSVL